jgi:ketosteroid isomerase-like protein
VLEPGRPRRGGAEGVRTELEAATKRFTDAINKGDAAAACYTEDGKILSPHGAVKGRKAIEKHFSGGHKAGVRSLKLEIGEVGGGGETAYESGTYKVYGEKDKLVSSGNYVVVWKKVGKEWLMHVDIWNSPPEEKAKVKDKK